MVTEERRLVDEALARLRLLEEERSILRTLYRYGNAIDYGQTDEFLDCYTDDAVFEFHAVNPPSAGGERLMRRFAGREQLAEFFAGHTHAPDRYHKHMLVEPVVDIIGDDARVQSYFARIDEADGRVIIRAMGRYLDKLVKCPDGVWRITERICEIEGRTAG
jgi:ketosteroid isomerase-like protein